MEKDKTIANTKTPGTLIVTLTQTSSSLGKSERTFLMTMTKTRMLEMSLSQSCRCLFLPLQHLQQKQEPRAEAPQSKGLKGRSGHQELQG